MLSRVFPMAIAADVAIEPAVVALIRNAASKIAGQTRYPNKRTAASAMPVGGHIGEALGLTDASDKPAFAETKYRTPTARSSNAPLVKLRRFKGTLLSKDSPAILSIIGAHPGQGNCAPSTT